MAYEKDVDESYWKVCWAWIIPYPCKAYRRVHKWCYRFRWVKETGYGFVKYWEGCEGESRFTWWTPAFFSFGGEYHTFEGIHEFEMCFDSPRSYSGRCAG